MSSYLENNLQNRSSDDGIDIKDILEILLRYKISIIFIILVVTFLGGIYAYLKTTIYESHLILKVEAQKQNTKDNIIGEALGIQSENLGNEIAILRSRSLALKVLKHVNLGTRYYVHKNLKKVELYTDSPFSVSYKSVSPSLSGYEFHIFPIDAKHFRLKIDPSLKMKLSYKIALLLGQDKKANALIHISKVSSYGTEINNPLFTLTVNKSGKMKDSDYSFTITPNNYMYGEIQSSLSIATGKEKSSIIYLAYRDNIPRRAVKILNVLAEEFANQSIQSKKAGAKMRLNFIEDQLADINKKLQRAETNLKDYKSSHTMVDLTTKSTSVVGKLDQLQTQLYKLNLQESVLKYLLSYLENNKNVVGIDVGSGTALSEPISSLIQKIQEANSQYDSMKADYTEQHPAVIKVKDELKSLRRSLRATIESSLRGTNHRKLALNKEIKKTQASIKKLPLEEQQMAELKRSFDVNEQVYNYLLQKKVETAIVESSTDSGIRVIDDAINTGPVKPNRIVIVLIGLVIGILLGIAQAFARSFIANTIQSIGDIEKNTVLPIYAVLPFFKRKKSLYKDALRAFLTKLEFKDPRPKVITITSSVKREGKTTTTLEFAKVIAESNRKAVVIDFDLREPKIHRQFKIFNDIGMSTLLSGENTLEEVIHNIEPNLDIITAGPVSKNPYGLIMSDKLNMILNELRAKYDYVLIESPAAGLVADALVLMRLADISFIIFKARYSKKSFLKNTNRFVYENQLENVGIILNGLELKKIGPWRGK